MTHGVRLLVTLVLVAGCERPAERVNMALASKVLKGVIAYPHSSLVSVSTGPDAVEVVLTTPAPVQEVATWYRQTLRLNGWELQSDGVANDGSISIYADSGNRPLWIKLKRNVGGPGTTYTLFGAQPDTTQAEGPKSRISSKRAGRR